MPKDMADCQAVNKDQEEKCHMNLEAKNLFPLPIQSCGSRGCESKAVVSFWIVLDVSGEDKAPNSSHL